MLPRETRHLGPWEQDITEARGGKIRHSGRTPEAYAAQLNADYVVGRDLTMLAAGRTIDWALASRAIGLRALVPYNTALGDAYAEAFTPVMDECLATAGARLAAVLNDALK